MKPSRFAALAMVASCVAPALAAQGVITYAPGTHRYHLISVISRTQEQAGQKADFEITNEQMVSLELQRHAGDTLDFAVTLDSTALRSNRPDVQLPDVSKMKGTRVTGLMSRTGKVYSHKSSLGEEDEDSRSLIEGMTRFLVSPPANARVGTHWTDTTSSTVQRNGAALQMRTITTSTVLGDTLYAGQKAWRVERKSVLSLHGTQDEMGQTLSVDGNGSGSGMYYVSAAGTYLGSGASQTMHMTVTPPGQAAVPIQQVVTSRVELMP